MRSLLQLSKSVMPALLVKVAVGQFSIAGFTDFPKYILTSYGIAPKYFH